MTNNTLEAALVNKLPYPDGYNVEDYSESELVGLSCFIFILMMTSFTVNGCSLFVYLTTKALHSPTDILFITVLFDSFVATLGSPMSFAHSVMRKRMGPTFCTIEATAVFFTGRVLTALLFKNVCTGFVEFMCDACCRLRRHEPAHDDRHRKIPQHQQPVGTGRSKLQEIVGHDRFAACTIFMCNMYMTTCTCTLGYSIMYSIRL